MVYHVGINFSMKKIYLYNKSNKQISKIRLIDGGNDIVDIYMIWETVVLNCDGKVGCVSILLYGYHNNEIRKKFIELGRKRGFEKIEIISLDEVIYYNAVSKIAYRPIDGDIIWIFDGSECHIWEKRSKKMYYIKRVSGDFLEKEDFEKIKLWAKLDKDPDVIIYNIKFDENFLNEIFPNSKLITYRNRKYEDLFENGLLLKARIMGNEVDVIELDACHVLSNLAVIKSRNRRLMLFDPSQILPVTKAVQVTLDESDQIVTVSFCKKTDNKQKGWHS